MPRKDITHFETKGESKSIAIAAASIIARYAFVKHMDQLAKSLNVIIPKGASNKVDLEAAKIVQKYDMQQLDKITKTHFKNRDKVLDLINRKGEINMLLITFSWQVILALIIICYLIWFIGKQLTNSTNKKKYIKHSNLI